MVKIIVDSAADQIKDIEEKLMVVPLKLIFGEEEYIDGVTINNKQFYEKLIEGDVMPTTAQATPADFSDVFSELSSNGDSAVVITLASTLSGTYQSAVIAASEYDGNIFVVDSKTAAIGMGILAEYALKLVSSGMSAEEIADKLTEARERVCVIAMLDTLEYLKKGGRISKTVAFAGGVLSIKPVLSLKDGEIVILGKARGSKQGNNLLVSEIEKAGGVDFDMPILLGYTGLDDSLLKKYIKDSAELWNERTDSLNTTVIGSAIGTHTGPGTIAVAFFKK